MSARLFPLIFLLAVAFGSTWAPVARAQSIGDQRYFSQTRYRIDNDRFWDFFQKRGGIRTFGYPVSGTFPLLGQTVQIFQRQVMQIQPDGSVGTLNLLDDGLMPYTAINGSTFPASDRNVLKTAPGVGDRDYHARALQFVKDNAPDEWQGQRVNFFTTFMNTVRYEEAFPDGKGDRALMAGLNLEIWGLPTSKPTPDPTNGGFIYLRFQRGIMHYDAACGCTQGLLLGQYLKSIMTLRDLPADLASQAKLSQFYGQFRGSAPGKVGRPTELPNTDLTNAFIREPIVVIDPGHGGAQIGASARLPDGSVLAEKDLTLRVGLRLGQLLSESGHSVIYTRTTDRMVNDGKDLTGDDKVNLTDDLQARVDLANAAGADLLISVHFNGVANSGTKGTQVFYNDKRPFSDRNRALADLVDAALVKALTGAGYPTLDRKSAVDSTALAGTGNFYILGPVGDPIKRASAMPGIIGEALYLTNDEDANAARQERIQEALARGYAEGIKQYFQRYPPQ